MSINPFVGKDIFLHHVSKVYLYTTQPKKQDVIKMYHFIQNPPPKDDCTCKLESTHCQHFIPALMNPSNRLECELHGEGFLNKGGCKNGNLYLASHTLEDQVNESRRAVPYRTM